MPSLPGLPWGRADVALQSQSHGPQVRNCAILGPIAVHRGLDTSHLWVVSSATTGLKMTVVNEERDARRITEHLYRTCRDVLSLRNGSAILSRLPTWVYPWLRECRARGVYLPPSPFMKNQPTSPQEVE